MTKTSKKPLNLADNRMYGTTVLGARGQLVIPAQARKDLKLQPGDRIMVMGKLNKMLGLIKSDELGELLDIMMEHFSDKSVGEKMRQHALKELTKLKKQHK